MEKQVFVITIVIFSDKMHGILLCFMQGSIAGRARWALVCPHSIFIKQQDKKTKVNYGMLVETRTYM